MQTTRPAHYQLESDVHALENHISELINGTQEVREVPDALKALRIFKLPVTNRELAIAC